MPQVVGVEFITLRCENGHEVQPRAEHFYAMNLLTRFSQWRRRRTIAKARYYLSLLVSSEFAHAMSDNDLASMLLRGEESRARDWGDKAQSIRSMARRFELSWQYVCATDPQFAQERIQALADSMVQGRS